MSQEALTALLIAAVSSPFMGYVAATFGLGWAKVAHQSWVTLCTQGLPAPIAKRRRAELASDLHESIKSWRDEGYRAHEIAGLLTWRLIRSLPSDIEWRWAILWPHLGTNYDELFVEMVVLTMVHQQARRPSLAVRWKRDHCGRYLDTYWVLYRILRAWALAALGLAVRCPALYPRWVEWGRLFDKQFLDFLHHDLWKHPRIYEHRWKLVSSLVDDHQGTPRSGRLD